MSCRQRDGTSKKEYQKMIEIKNIMIEMKNAFDGLISRLNVAKKECLSMRISP